MPTTVPASFRPISIRRPRRWRSRTPSADDRRARLPSIRHAGIRGAWAGVGRIAALCAQRRKRLPFEGRLTHWPEGAGEQRHLGRRPDAKSSAPEFVSSRLVDGKAAVHGRTERRRRSATGNETLGGFRYGDGGSTERSAHALPLRAGEVGGEEGGGGFYSPRPTTPEGFTRRVCGRFA
jgi:hypothetical protein